MNKLSKVKSRSSVEVITSVRISGKKYSSVHQASIAMADVVVSNMRYRASKDPYSSYGVHWHANAERLKKKAIRRCRPIVAKLLGKKP